MAGLVPAIHALLAARNKSWMPGTRPGMTLRAWKWIKSRDTPE
jgi:hypothetical protein